jgi:uncharacterized protein YjbI with pentapeptide repeats
VNKEADLRHSSSAHPPLLHCEQRSLRQRKVTQLAYDREHGKLWQDIRADLDWTRARASKVAHAAEWAFGRRTARVLGVVMLFTVVVALLLVFLDWYIAPTKPGDKKDLVLAMAQILAGSALLLGLYFTWRSLQVNREGQITERFTRAIDQLGHESAEVRIGGIYALAAIAFDSDSHYWPVMEILSAYIRERSRWSPKGDYVCREDPKPEEALSEEALSHHHRLPDIQAILYILIERKYYYDEGEDKYIWLTNTDLQHADLRGIHLERARLRGANLKRARLGSAHLWRARLRNTIFEGANLEKAQLQQADLEKAILCKADLEGAYIRGAFLIKANIQGANLRKADLRGAFLEGALLQKAMLQGANIQGALLQGAYLQKAMLQGANLQRAYLRGAYLQGADLRNTLDLTDGQLEQAYGDQHTLLPDNLKRPAHWGVETDQQTEGD